MISSPVTSGLESGVLLVASLSARKTCARVLPTKPSIMVCYVVMECCCQVADIQGCCMYHWTPPCRPPLVWIPPAGECWFRYNVLNPSNQFWGIRIMLQTYTFSSPFFMVQSHFALFQQIIVCPALWLGGLES